MANKYNIPERLQGSLNGLLQMVLWLKEREDLSKMDLLEVGSWTGLSSKLFAGYFKSVLCVDPWESTAGINTKHNMRKVFQLFRERTEVYKNVSYIKGKYEDIDDIKCDIIYIDGLHTYEQVKKDIKKALKIKGIKYICGHDYYGKFPGVIKAVNETLGKPDAKFADSSWVKEIK